MNWVITSEIYNQDCETKEIKKYFHDCSFEEALNKFLDILKKELNAQKEPYAISNMRIYDYSK